MHARTICQTHSPSVITAVHTSRWIDERTGTCRVNAWITCNVKASVPTRNCTGNDPQRRATSYQMTLLQQLVQEHGREPRLKHNARSRFAEAHRLRDGQLHELHADRRLMHQRALLCIQGSLPQ